MADSGRNAKKKPVRTRPYLQWSKKQSGVVVGFFIFYFIFIAGCVIYRPEAAEWLVKLAMYVMMVMIFNLGFYSGNSVLEKIKGNKLLDGMMDSSRQRKDEEEDEDEDDDSYG